MEATSQNFLRSSSQTERAGNSSFKKSKMLEIAQTIAKVDDLVQAIHKNESHNTKLQQQLKDFQATAQQVQQLYNKEKNDHSKAKNDLEQLQKEYSKIDVNLTNMSMVNEQLKARLAEYDGRPINFDNLVVKYVKIVNKLQGHDILSYYPDKDLVERLREYCVTKKLKIPKANISPKKTTSRRKKPKTEEKSVQCDPLGEILSENHGYPTCKTKNKVQDQSTQCSVKKREQASQYISTMITRQTNTEKLVQKHVQTMFPEAPIAIDDVHDILNLFTEWSNIRSVSPLRASPNPKINKSCKDILKKFSTTGTCTMLCNIRRKIDYLPVNNSANIKQEIFTPSVSPTLTSYQISRPRLGSLSNNLPINISSSSLLNLFNSTTNSSLGQLSPSAFNELWQIFGKMLLSLLQTNNTDNTSANQNTPLNQQQFLDWLLELYTNSQPQNTTTAETQTLEQMASNVSRSPLFFNDASLLSADVMRPQPQRILQEENVARSNMREDETNLSLSANLIDNNPNSQIHIADSSNSPVKFSQHGCDSMMREIHQRQNISNTDELHKTHIFEPNLHKLSQNTTLEEGEKSSEKTKIKDNILDQIQKFLPDINLSKKKRKAMKRLLRSKSHRKKSFDIRKTKIENDNNNCDTVETAVDFLKTFAVTQKINQPIEEDMSETEKIFLQQVSCKNMPNNVPNILISEEELNISNPLANLKQTEPTLKREISKSCQQIAKKYELLFGESDSELGDQEIESSTFSPKHVIKSPTKLAKGHSKYGLQSLKPKNKNDNLTMFSPNQNCTNQHSKNTIPLVENKFNQISRNAPHEQLTSVNINTPTFINSCNIIASQDTTVTPILKDLEFTYLPDVLHSISARDAGYFGLNSNKESLNSINESNSFSFSNIYNSVENDLELSSDDCSGKEDVEDVVEKAKSSKEAATIEEIIYININNYNEEINQKSENVQSQEIITLQGSLNETNKSTAENSIKYQKNLNKIDFSENSHQIINFTCLDRMENVSENYSSNDSMDNHQIINSSMLPPYSSDIEKDLELSSDDESQASDSNVNDIQGLSSRTFEESKDIDFSEERFKSFDNLTEQQYRNLESIDHFELQRGENYKLNNFKVNVNISPTKFSKYENQAESNGSSISVIRTGKENIFKTIKNSTKTIDAEAGDVVSLRKEENLNKFLLYNNDENIFESNFEVDNNTKQIREEKQQIQNLESNQNKYNSCKENSVQLNRQIESEDELKSEQILAKPRNNEESENESIIQSESEKTSLVWSVITVSNASLQKETLNIKEINQEFNEINEDKDIPKLSSLRTFRLIKKMHTNAYNTKVIREANDSKENSNKYQFIKPENNINPLDDEEAVPTIAKPNISKIDQEEKVTILSSSLLKAANYIEGTGVDHQNYLNEDNNSSSHEMLMVKTLEKSDVSEVESMANNINKNINEINQEFNETNGDNSNEDIPKVSNLRTLKLMDLNQNQKISYDFLLNTRAVREANDSQENANKYQFIKPENKEAVPTIAKPNISKIDQKEKVTILSSSILKAANYIEGTSVDHQNYLNEDNNSCSHEMLMVKTLENCDISKVESIPNNVSISCKYKVVVDDIDFNDNLSVEDELVIDEELNDNNTRKESNDGYHNNSISIESDQNYNDTINSSISTLLNSTIYNEVLTESFQPIVNDLLEEEMATTPEIKQKRGRKRKTECLTELHPRKCSQRLKAKRMMLEESLNFSQTTIELGKYTKCHKNSTRNIQTKSPVKDDVEKECETVENCELSENENSLHLGFFRERMNEEDAIISNSRAVMVAKSRKPILSDDKIFTISCEGEKIDRPEQQNNIFLESENLNDRTTIESEPEVKPYNTLKDSLEPFEIFIYSESPQSPVSSTTNTVASSETCVIPLERPPQFVLQDNHLTLFDVLIKSYRIENRKHVLESAIAKVDKRKRSILNRFCEEIRSYCYSEMELDLYCTSARAINKILTICPDYDLIQRALITVAEHAEGTNTPENELPSIIQEMPPRHLPKCLQRLFVFLKNLVTRNENFCQDLMKKIELLLFNFKQAEHLSLQATLNLTQLYLMASKVQENLQSAKHPARLFIAKSLYFYFQKAILMVHEVLMWFPTVLPHREDKTYDRSDALISVIQYALMNTKYEMKDKPDLRGKILLSKLRYEYHFEPFKPTTDEIINVLVEKLKNSKFYNISLAFGLLCKRMGVLKVEQYILNQCLLPLANEYYSLALKTNDYDIRIAVLLEVISILVKPLPIQTDTQKYFNELSRFLNGFERQIIQEAALCSLLRLQRFDAKCCYDLIRHFQPTYNLKTQTETMLKTFLYRRPLTYWKNLQSQS